MLPTDPANPTLILGDCLDYVEEFADGSIEAIVTDPPYGLGDKWRGGRKEWPLADNGNNTKWDDSVVSALPRIVERFRYAIVWGGNYYNLPPARGWLVWDKIVRKFTSGHCELAWTNFDQPIRAFNYPTALLASEKYHPTQKPLDLMRWCLSFLPENCSIVDPFMGSGTTILAAMLSGRRSIGFENDARSFSIATRRIEALRDGRTLKRRRMKPSVGQLNFLDGD